jgi:Tfp pilus assembly protein FimT
MRISESGSVLMSFIVSLGIIALLSAVSIPYIKQYQPNLKLNSDAKIITSDLRYAQQLTITEQITHKVSFNIESDTYNIIKNTEPATTIKTVTLDSEVSFQSITGLTNNEVIFNYYGGVSEPGQIILTNINSKTKTIDVKPSGYIQLN